MAKPTKYASHICTVCSVISFIGIVVGFIYSVPVVTMILLLPTAIYEAYRTEGKYTTKASYILVVVLIGTIILLFSGVDFNIADFLGRSTQSIAGYLIPLGDLKVVFPAVIGILAIVLFSRTRGIYTRWLSVIIFITSFAVIFMVDSEVFNELVKYGIKEGLNNIR